MAVKKSPTSTPAKTKPVGTTVSRTAAAGTSPVAEKLLVCLQHPFAAGSWALTTNATVPAADGLTGHLWQVTAGFELLAPRFMEGQASRQPVTLAVKGFSQATPANNAAWANATRSETDAINPLRVIVRLNAAGKVELSLAYGAKHAGETRLHATADTRWFNGDVAFAENGDTGVTVGAVAVVSAQPWSLVIGGSNAAVKGLAFDGGWRKNLEQGPKPVADGACTTTGSWAFTAMTAGEYAEWCAANGRRPDIV